MVEREPEFVYGRDGAVVGVDAWVRAYGPDGREARVDPHRRIINPPTVADGTPDPVEAFYRAVADSVAGTPHPRGWSRRRDRGTVTTVFAGTNDGMIISDNATYSTARSGSGLGVDSSNLYAGQYHQVTFVCLEGFLAFDTTAIADADTVSAVVLDLYLVDDVSTGSDFLVEARERDWSSGGLTTADWVAGASLSGLTLMASINTSGIGATGSYKTFTSEAAFLTATNLKTGTVYLLLSSSRTRTGTAPSTSTDEYVGFRTAEQSGTTEDPKLTITHAGAATAPPIFTPRPLRVWSN